MLKLPHKEIKEEKVKATLITKKKIKNVKAEVNRLKLEKRSPNESRLFIKNQ